MRRRTYRRVLEAIFTPEQMRKGRYANAHAEARRTTWAKSFGRQSPILEKIANLFKRHADRRKAMEK